MKSKILLAVLILCTAVMAGAQELEAKFLYKVQLDKHSAPADVVVYDDGRAGVYDAYAGSYTVYDGGKGSLLIENDAMKGGNCFTGNGNYFLFCNSVNSSVDMISAAGETYRSFKMPSEFKGKFDPTDALVSDGYLFTPDNDNHRIVKTDMTTGEVVSVMGEYGNGKLEFWYPYAVAMDSKGILYVSEVLNTRVQKITKELKFYEFFGSWGVKPGEFFRPTGIALYKGKTLLVGDGYTGIIQYLNEDGQFAGVLKDKDGKKLTLGSITHMRINGDTLAVVDAYDKAVYIYKLEGLK